MTSRRAIPMRHSRRWCAIPVLSLAAALAVVGDARAQTTSPGDAATSVSDEWAGRLAMAEAVVAREEAASERPFDPPFRAKARELLAALPVATLEAQTGDDGLGLSALGDSQADLVYTPLRPCRILDTRKAGGALLAGTTRSFLVTGTDLSAQGGNPAGCGVPYGPATAAVINLVAVSPAGPGDLRITPFGTPMPQASIINYAAVPGLAIANGPAVALCDPAVSTCSADITIQADASAVDLVADVQGYFRRVSSGGVGTALLADSAVTAVKMADSAVTAVKMADGAVTTAKIGAGVVVRSLNGETDAVTLAGSNGLGVTHGSGTVTVASDATPANTAGTIVSRDGTGSFSAGTLDLAGNLNLPSTTASTGMITLGGLPFMHGYGVTQNTFVGGSAGNLTMSGGGYNSGFGWAALSSNTNGESNTALGALTLVANTTGSFNTGVGLQALTSNSSGHSNTAVGQGALSANTTGNYNSALGLAALGNNTTGGTNTALGAVALLANTTGIGNTAVGFAALNANLTGNNNTAVGIGALLVGTASDNTAVGNAALNFNTEGTLNTAAGSLALYSTTTGSHNSAFGQALVYNTTGDYNSAFGEGALGHSTTGTGNAAFGSVALLNLETGSFNIAVGHTAGVSLVSGDRNIYIGADTPATSESNVIRIGDASQNAIYMAGISGQTSAGGVAVYANSDGKLGTVTSSRRYKEEIADMEAESDVLLRLRPVSFYYRSELDDTHLRQYGLVAEEVAEVAPQLVAYDRDGMPQTVRYHFVNAMLLNEVQRQRRELEEERRQAEEQRRMNEEQKSTIEDLEARLARLEAALAGDR